MAARPIDPSVIEAVLIDWRLGRLSQREIAAKHGISKGAVGNVCKGVERDMGAIVGAGIQYKQGLMQHDGRIVGAIEDEVDELVQYKKQFYNYTIHNIGTMAQKIGAETTIVEHRIAQAAIKDGKETVFGKTPDTAIQINNSRESTPSSEIPTITKEEWMAAHGVGTSVR